MVRTYIHTCTAAYTIFTVYTCNTVYYADCIKFASSYSVYHAEASVLTCSVTVVHRLYTYAGADTFVFKDFFGLVVEARTLYYCITSFAGSSFLAEYCTEC